jgi:cyclopropane fatty-acyl-phospholipid synthase-like methyltransferase
MKIKRNVWNETFKDKGKVFTKPQEDIPKIVKLFKKYNVKRILDLGCGSGRHLIFLARHGFDVYGIDMAKSGIKISKKWLDKEGLKANLKIRDIYKKLPYKDNFFDAIVSTQTLHHEKIEKIRKLIKEMERILKINGLIFITVFDLKCVPNKNKKQIAPRTFILLKGNDVGVPHYSFNKNILRKEFKSFKILDIWFESSGRNYCLLGQKAD